MARWRAAKEIESGEKDRRPYLASECTDLPKCEKYRLEIIREISNKVAQIQNGKLFTITELDIILKSNSFSWSWRISYTRFKR